MTPAIPPEDDEGKTRLSRNWPGWLIAYIVTLVVIRDVLLTLLQ